jgi:hypothetical protein
MGSLLIFLGVLVGIVGVAVVVNKVTGTQAQYLEDLQLAPGEQQLLQLDGTDFFVIDNGPQPLVRSFLKLKRHRLVLTHQRLLVGQLPLGGSKHLIEKVLLFSRQAPGAAGLERVDGGFYGGGFSVYLVSPGGFGPGPGGEPGELAVVAERTPSSANVTSFRLFVDPPEALVEALRALTGGA